MIDYTYNNLFMDDSTSKQLIIEFDNTVITNEDLFDQTMTLEESLCSEKELRFGVCEASVLKFKVANIVAPIKGKWLSVKMILEKHAEEPFVIGNFKVAEDKLTSDRQWREITAYDAMHDIINADMAAWYNSVFPQTDTTMTMAEFRTRFTSHFGLEQVVPEGGLVNDSMIVTKTIAITATEENDTEYGRVSVVGESLSGRDIITAICEINGCFGHIGRDGKFHYIYLQQDIMGIYPANFLFPDRVPDDWNYLPQAKTGHLYPQDPKGASINKNYYIPPPKCDDYMVQTIERVQIREEENDIGGMYPMDELDSPNTYVIEDNFLVYGKGTDELNKIAQNVYSKIKDIIYRPFNVDCKGNPCFEVGDAVRMPTKYCIIETYILQRTLKGIQALRDAYSSTGVEKYSEQVNGTQRSIRQLKGKTNIFARNLEETKIRIDDVEEELSAEIQVLAGKVILKVTSGGDMALVELGADASKGTVFKVMAKNLQLTAEEAINLMAGGNINLTGKNITINSDNFSVSADGTARVKQIIEFGISGDAVGQFNSAVSDSEAMRLARQAIAAAQQAANAAAQAAAQAQSAANVANTTVNNLVNVVIPDINNAIKGVSDRVTALGG